MPYPFPSLSWLEALRDALNSDEKYAATAKKWEGDLLILIDPDPNNPATQKPIPLYLDLWHGKCRKVAADTEGGSGTPNAAFVLRAPLSEFLKILEGKLDPVQAMATRRLRVDGNLAYMMRNVPVVLDFVRVCRGIEIARDG